MNPKSTEGHGTARRKFEIRKAKLHRCGSGANFMSFNCGSLPANANLSWATAALFSIKAKFNLMKILTLIFDNVNPD